MGFYEGTNVRFLPMLPREEYPAVLYASDICLATLKPQVKTPVVPSKILSIMSAGKPVLASMDLDGDAPRLIEDARCGRCVPAGNAGALSEAIRSLYLDRSLGDDMGANGRVYAETHFSLKRAARSYAELLSEVAGDRASLSWKA